MARETNPTNGVTGTQQVTTATTDKKSAADMVAELRGKLERYKDLEAEAAKLDQERATLENYVANMMATRAQKKINYFEEHADDSEESDFEVSDDE
ncbi:hypothetical protein GGI11_002944 [Coemansia sp. RSA 2049]|nr:hypothetical protein GGI11_002944 [Coemansia sp. RSA 2049]